MKRAARLQAARHWLPTYQGKDLIKGYARWFGVDRRCALAELQLLGVELDPRKVEALTNALQAHDHAHRSSQSEGGIPEGYGTDWDEHFLRVAGLTPGLVPFGAPWDDGTVPEE